MNTQARNVFLGVLGLVAALGVLLVVLATRPRDSSATNGPGSDGAAAAGPAKTVTYAANGGQQTVQGQPVSGDPAQGGRYVLGKADAPVTVVEFANYQCIHCKTFSEKTQGQLVSEFVDTGKVRYVYRDLPFAGQANVERASVAAACAADQGKYWEFHHALYRAQSDWGGLSGDGLDAKLADYAGQLGLDGGAVRSCLGSGKHDAAVRADVEAAGRLGVTGTPAFFVDGYRYEGAIPIEAFRAILKDVR